MSKTGARFNVQHDPGEPDVYRVFLNNQREPIVVITLGAGCPESIRKWVPRIGLYLSLITTHKDRDYG